MDGEGYTLAELENLPTLATGQFDNLKVDDGNVRVWLSRCGIADGMEFDNQVTVEEFNPVVGYWTTTATYEAV